MFKEEEDDNIEKYFDHESVEEGSGGSRELGVSLSNSLESNNTGGSAESNIESISKITLNNHEIFLKDNAKNEEVENYEMTYKNGRRIRPASALEKDDARVEREGEVPKRPFSANNNFSVEYLFRKNDDIKTGMPRSTITRPKSAKYTPINLALDLYNVKKIRKERTGPISLTSRSANKKSLATV
jgi:hypothetical protein